MGFVVPVVVTVAAVGQPANRVEKSCCGKCAMRNNCKHVFCV
jgi:hypothetical protein